MSDAAKPTGARKSPPPFRLGDVVVRAGTRKQLELPIARLPIGAWATMPIVVVHGSRPGPRVWLSGALHGDELNGVEIVRRVASRVRPRALRGTVLAVPMVNAFGVATGSRYLPDRRDLNRSFPGSARGSLASQLAHVFWSNVVDGCDVGLDFHTGSGGRCNLAQIRCDLEDSDTRRLAETFAAPLLLHSDLRDGSLRAAAHDAGVRVLLYEAGEALRFSEPDIDRGVDGALRVLAALDMLDDAPDAPIEPPALARRSKWSRAVRSGFCHMRVALGDIVDKDDVVAVISNGVSGRDVVVRARVSGVVIGVLRTATVHRGEAIIHIAETE